MKLIIVSGDGITRSFEYSSKEDLLDKIKARFSAIQVLDRSISASTVQRDNLVRELQRDESLAETVVEAMITEAERLDTALHHLKEKRRELYYLEEDKYTLKLDWLRLPKIFTVEEWFTAYSSENL